MAENEYTVTIRNESEESIAQEVGGAGGITAGNLPQSAGGEKSGGLSQGAKKALKGVLSVYRPVKSTINQVASYELSQVEIRTGSREQHQRASFAYSVGSKLWNAGENIALGAAFGGMPGAVAGLALSTLSSMISLVQAQDSLNTQRQLEDITRNLSAQRATVSGSRYMNASEF